MKKIIFTILTGLCSIFLIVHTVKTGKYADFILIDQNVLTCFPMSIYRTNVTATFFEGKQVYERKAE